MNPPTIKWAQFNPQEGDPIRVEIENGVEFTIPGEGRYQDATLSSNAPGTATLTGGSFSDWEKTVEGGIVTWSGSAGGALYLPTTGVITW